MPRREKAVFEQLVNSLARKLPYSSQELLRAIDLTQGNIARIKKANFGIERVHLFYDAAKEFTYGLRRIVDNCVGNIADFYFAAEIYGPAFDAGVEQSCIFSFGTEPTTVNTIDFEIKALDTLSDRIISMLFSAIYHPGLNASNKIPTTDFEMKFGNYLPSASSSSNYLRRMRMTMRV